jgi:hypothetical protein
MPRHPPYTLSSLTTFIDHRHDRSPTEFAFSGKLSFIQAWFAFPREKVGAEEELTPGPVTVGQTVTVVAHQALPERQRIIIAKKGARRRPSDGKTSVGNTPNHS